MIEDFYAAWIFRPTFFLQKINIEKRIKKFSSENIYIFFHIPGTIIPTINSGEKRGRKKMGKKVEQHRDNREKWRIQRLKNPRKKDCRS
jgi:hypothetical protein